MDFVLGLKHKTHLQCVSWFLKKGKVFCGIRKYFKEYSKNIRAHSTHQPEITGRTDFFRSLRNSHQDHPKHETVETASLLHPSKPASWDALYRGYW